MTTVQIVVALMCYLGVIAGAALPYLRKRTDVSKWDHKYTWAALVACGMAVVTLETTILQYAVSVTAWDGLLMPLFTAFMTGFGMVAGTSELMKLIEDMKTRWIPVKE